MINKNILAPSLYAANLTKIDSDLNFLKQNNVNDLHFDVMDGDFVPFISIGQLLFEQIKKNYDFKIDIHLMVNNNLNFIKTVNLNLVEFITIHIESKDFKQAYEYLKAANVKFGIALKPDTSIELIKPYINEIDVVLPMSVTPGKSGQSFIDISNKIKQLKNWGFNKIIQVDGGINDITLPTCLKAGANHFVVGSYTFANPTNIIKIQKLIES